MKLGRRAHIIGICCRGDMEYADMDYPDKNVGISHLVLSGQCPIALICVL